MRIDLKTMTGEVTDTTGTTDDPNGSFEVILSTSDLDRDGEIIDPGAFDPLPDHIAMDIDHGLSVATTVGSGVPTYDDDGKTLRVVGTYASTDLGQQTRALVNEKHIRLTSAAFRTLKTKMVDGVPHVVKAMLINGTFTPIAANTKALVLESKELALKEGKRNSTGDASKIQDIHDLTAELGADCTTTKTIGVVRAKSLVGSVEALQDRVRDALEDAYPTGATVDAYGWADYGWTCVRGVVPEGTGGYVVFQVWGSTEFDSDETYRQDFTDDGAVVTLTGDPTIVDVHEIVVPDADAPREEAEAVKTADDSDDAQRVLNARATALRGQTA